jgi:hypothetical protein
MIITSNLTCHHRLTKTAGHRTSKTIEETTKDKTGKKNQNQKP